MGFNSLDWAGLPEHIIIDIFTYLSLADRTRASYSCKSWSEYFSSPYLWNHFDFYFYIPEHSRYLKCIELHGRHLKSVYIELDQGDDNNRKNACQVIHNLAKEEDRRLKKLVIKFAGQNPLFYAGLEFVNALMTLFGPPPTGSEVKTLLEEIDLSGLIVAFDDKLFYELSANHPNLRKLSIQNKTLVCKVSPTCVLRLVQRCRKLTDLQLYNVSINEDILLAFTEKDRAPLEHLSLICRREEKYLKEISGDTWCHLVAQFPDLRVSLVFDHTIELEKISVVMKPEIPVKALRLETFTDIHNEVRMASGYYNKTLEKFVLNTRVQRTAPQLNQALLELATECTKLNAIHVFCVLEQATVEKIFELHPHIKERGTYTLKYIPEPHPWKPGKDC